MYNFKWLFVPKGDRGQVDETTAGMIDKYLSDMQQDNWTSVLCSHYWNREFNRQETILLLVENYEHKRHKTIGN